MSTSPFDSTRRSQRRRLSRAAILIFENDEDAPTCSATTVDVSDHGARIQLQAVLTQGQVLEFKTEDSAQPVRCRVVWAGDMSSDREAEAGLEFLTPHQV